MESCTFIQEKLSEWNFGELIKDFEDEQINKETFLSLDTSSRLEVLIRKIGPRAKFRKRLQEYKKSLNRQHDEEKMETNVETNVATNVETNMNLAVDRVASHMNARSFSSQGILATQLFVLRHRLTAPAQKDLNTLIKSIIPTFTAEPIFSTNKLKMHKHIRNQEQSGFFLVTSLKDLLKDTLESYGSKLLPKAINCEDEINDIMDGKMYQKLIETKTLSDDDITLLWNCDGVPVEQNAIWPLQLTINELPYQIRKQNVLVPAIWFGKGAPNMADFLRPFIDECLELTKAPLKWIDGNGAAHSSRVFVLVCSSDAVARPLLQNRIQFNGEYGCDWCLHPGTVVDKGAGKMRSYAYDEQKQSPRCEKMYRADARSAEASGKPVNGVKGVSILQELPVFDIVQGFVPEYSHAVLLGVTKQLVFLWLEGKNSKEPWYIGDREDELDTHLISLRPVLKITRSPISPISLKSRDNWKAVDWQAFLLFYGIYVLEEYLASPYLHHFYLLSCSVHILLQDTITVESLKYVRASLERFVKDMAVLYGEEHVTFNCHQLIHLHDSVQNWGPLWATSALGFESNNKDLQALLCDVITDSEGIEKKFSIWQHVPNHLRSFVFSNLDLNDLIHLNLPENVCKRVYTPFGDCCHLDINDSMMKLVQDLLKDTGQVSSYEGFRNGHLVYHCANSKAADKTKCIVKLNKGGYGQIHQFLEVKRPCTCTSCCLCHVCPVIVVKMFHTRPVLGLAQSVFVKGKLTEELRAFYTHDIKRECVYVNGWIVTLPNTHEIY